MSNTYSPKDLEVFVGGKRVSTPQTFLELQALGAAESQRVLNRRLRKLPGTVSFIHDEVVVQMGDIVHTDAVERQLRVLFALDPIRRSVPLRWHHGKTAYLEAMKAMWALGPNTFFPPAVKPDEWDLATGKDLAQKDVAEFQRLLEEDLKKCLSPEKKVSYSRIQASFEEGLRRRIEDYCHRGLISGMSGTITERLVGPDAWHSTKAFRPGDYYYDHVSLRPCQKQALLDFETHMPLWATTPRVPPGFVSGPLDPPASPVPVDRWFQISRKHRIVARFPDGIKDGHSALGSIRGVDFWVYRLPEQDAGDHFLRVYAERQGLTRELTKEEFEAFRAAGGRTYR